MDLDPGYIIVSLITSSFGLAYLAYGKRRGHIPSIVSGLVLLGTPFFTSNVPGLLISGVIVGAIPWFLRHY